MVTAVPASLSRWAGVWERTAYANAYADALQLWPVPHDERMVETPYGGTHVIVSGPVTGEPVVLLHAASLSATQWYLQARDLGSTFRLYALDIMGDIGLSRQSRPIHTRAQGAEWLSGVLDGLALQRPILVGSSFGGFHAANLAVASPERARALVLLAPAATILPFRLMANVMIRAGSLLPMPFTVKPGLKGMMHGQLPDPLLVRQMELGVSGFRYDRHGLYPSALSEVELMSIRIPTLLLVGEREMIYDPGEAIERTQALVAGSQAKLVPGAGHLLNLQRPVDVDTAIRAFLTEHIGVTRQADANDRAGGSSLAVRANAGPVGA